MAQRRTRARARIPAAEVVDYLGGLSFPCSKEDIVQLAVGQQAPAEISAALESLPEERYSSMDDIMRHFGRTL